MRMERRIKIMYEEYFGMSKTPFVRNIPADLLYRLFMFISGDVKKSWRLRFMSVILYFLFRLIITLFWYRTAFMNIKGFSSFNNYLDIINVSRIITDFYILIFICFTSFIPFTLELNKTILVYFSFFMIPEGFSYCIYIKELQMSWILIPFFLWTDSFWRYFLIIAFIVFGNTFMRLIVIVLFIEGYPGFIYFF